MPTTRWNSVPGCLSLELSRDEDGDVYDLPFCRSLPILNPFSFIDGDRSVELLLEFFSSGSHTEASMFGGPDRLGWPAEHDEERTLAAVTLCPDDGEPVTLPPAEAQAVFDVYQDLIDAAEVYHSRIDDGDY